MCCGAGQRKVNKQWNKKTHRDTIDIRMKEYTEENDVSRRKVDY